MRAFPDLPELPGVEHRSVDVGGVILHVAEAGEGPPLVLVHGWPQNWWCFRDVIVPLAQSHRVIALDLHGFGWSQAPRGRYDKAGFAGDIAGVLDALEIERAGLVGHDWGGFAGFLACLQAPERFSAFLGLAIAPPWPPARLAPLDLLRFYYQVLLASPGLGRLVASSPRVLGTGLARDAGPAWGPREREIFFGTLLRRDRAHVSQSVYRTFLMRELRPVLRGDHARTPLQVPTRLLIGDRDPVIKADAISYEGRATDMEIEVVPGVGHWIPELVPELVVARARELFA